MCVGLAAGAVGLAVDAHPGFDWRATVVFGALCFLAEQYPITLPQWGGSHSVSFVITIAAIVTAGPAEAAIATLFGAINVREALASPPHRHVFNAAQLTLSAALGGVVYVQAGGPVGTIDGLFPRVLVPVALCTGVDFVVNTALVSGAVAIARRTPLRATWERLFSGLIVGSLAFALLGLLLAILYLQMGAGAVLFLLMPLLVARHAFQAAIAWQGIYDDTVRALISALEAKDPYTRGHAERVSRLSEMAARTYGLSEEHCRAIRYAALMHDVGKLVVLSNVLQKPGKLTPEEYEHMKEHPLHGVEIVSEIEVLEEALVGVRHHHERVDGAGYPDGLHGDEIPLFARLITVCDAFDSMTSTRTYRVAKTIEEALAELHRCAGTQFDPAALAALERALERYGWQPHPEADDEPAMARPRPAPAAG